VLFVCVSNNGKSVMTQGLMRKIAGDRITATSAGIRAKTGVNAQSVEALAELGIDISTHQGQLPDDLITAADLVIVLGSQAYVEPVDDTPHRNVGNHERSLRGIEGIDRMRLIRDDIADRVTDLTTRLTSSARQHR
jgi:arsenate-mycothiol transferase